MPATWSHNTAIEIAWTLIPVLILVFIAVFSFKLLFEYHDMPKPYMTVKATGYQWYWGYEYPDQKMPEFVSNILPEDKANAAGKPYKLAATEPLVVPVNQTVQILTTGADVIHAFAVPAFGVIMDAVPWPGELDLVQGRHHRHLLRLLPRALRRRPRLHAHRGEGGEPGRLRCLGAVEEGRADRLRPAARACRRCARRTGRRRFRHARFGDGSCCSGARRAGACRRRAHRQARGPGRG